MATQLRSSRGRASERREARRPESERRFHSDRELEPGSLTCTLSHTQGIPGCRNPGQENWKIEETQRDNVESFGMWLSG